MKNDKKQRHMQHLEQARQEAVERHWMLIEEKMHEEYGHLYHKEVRDD